jgi:hypothetical protein
LPGLHICFRSPSVSAGPNKTMASLASPTYATLASVSVLRQNRHVGCPLGPRRIESPWDRKSSIDVACEPPKGQVRSRWRRSPSPSPACRRRSGTPAGADRGRPSRRALYATLPSSRRRVLDRQLAVLAHPDGDQQRDRGCLAVEPDVDHCAVEDQSDDRLVSQRSAVPSFPVGLYLPPHPADGVLADRRRTARRARGERGGCWYRRNRSTRSARRRPSCAAGKPQSLALPLARRAIIGLEAGARHRDLGRSEGPHERARPTAPVAATPAAMPSLASLAVDRRAHRGRARATSSSVLIIVSMKSRPDRADRFRSGQTSRRRDKPPSRRP